MSDDVSCVIPSMLIKSKFISHSIEQNQTKSTLRWIFDYQHNTMAIKNLQFQCIDVNVEKLTCVIVGSEEAVSNAKKVVLEKIKNVAKPKTNRASRW